MPFYRFAAAVCLACALSACGGIVDPAKNTTENFAGTVPVGGISPSLHTFSVGKTGEIFVTITALSPDQNVLVGVVLGQPSNGQCLPYQGYINNVAQLNRQALGGQIQKGSYCVSVYDGALTLSQPTNYTVRVSHP
jgi:hypothetical protein